MKPSVSFVRMVLIFGLYAGGTSTHSAAADAIPETAFRMDCSLKTAGSVKTPPPSAGIVADDGDKNSPIHNHFIIRLNLEELREAEAEAAAKTLTMAADEKVTFAGFSLKILPSTAPVSTDPLQTPQQRELALKMNTRVQLFSSPKGNIKGFYSQTEYGLNFPNFIKNSRDTALLVKASGGRVDAAFKWSF